MDIQQFCEAFLHIEETPEIGMNEFCICDIPCKKKTVTGIVLLYSKKNEKIFSKLYVNTKIKNENVHAEQLLAQDQDIIDRLDDCRRILLYLTYNPCHYSGGHCGFRKHVSCTNTLIKYKEQYLDPRNIFLEIAISYPYRAHWKVRSECCNLQNKFAPFCYSAAIHSARKGLSLLCKKGIKVRELNTYDYMQLLDYCSPCARNTYTSNMDFILEKRKSCDLFVKSVLSFYKDFEQNDMKCGFCSES